MNIEIPLWIKNLLERLIGDKFTGSLKINFYKGGIANIEKIEVNYPPSV